MANIEHMMNNDGRVGMGSSVAYKIEPVNIIEQSQIFRPFKPAFNEPMDGLSFSSISNKNGLLTYLLGDIEIIQKPFNFCNDIEGPLKLRLLYFRITRRGFNFEIAAFDIEFQFLPWFSLHRVTEPSLMTSILWEGISALSNRGRNA
ncbi:hypothetical protein BZG36_03989 [Bifiguratus adelaidae]|uniref:Uncharacterized protein n=1 Tax=Bifiguratus adelaidae TaxID=1938954 RepID=A0A261Y1R2_9FUNG|nr:hypothetical protein BZG36_03989 [Bifiguratus adelaidae]